MVTEVGCLIWPLWCYSDVYTMYWSLSQVTTLLKMSPAVPVPGGWGRGQLLIAWNGTHNRLKLGAGPGIIHFLVSLLMPLSSMCTSGIWHFHDKLVGVMFSPIPRLCGPVHPAKCPVGRPKIWCSNDSQTYSPNSDRATEKKTRRMQQEGKFTM